jgi:hypothetical protein
MKIHFRVATAAAFRGRGVLGPETLQGDPAAIKLIFDSKRPFSLFDEAYRFYNAGLR